MANPHLIELLVERLVGLVPRSEFDAARAEFERRGGAFSAADTWNEERLRALADDIVVPRASSWAALPLSDEERAWVLGMRQCERSLFLVEPEERLRCLLGGAIYRVRFAEAPSARLRPGDIFDGRIALVGDAIRVLPGMIFHAEEAHESLRALVQQARVERTPREVVLDGLMRMRMRHDRFVSIHAKHIYRFESLQVVEIKAASWKGRSA
jgi:hypothetical protein